MANDTFTQKHSYVRAFVLLALVIAVLPLRAASAAEQQVVIPKATVNASVWKANWLAKNAGTHGAEQLIYEAFLVQLYRQTPALSSHSAVATLTELRSKYDVAASRGQDASYRDLKTYDEIVHTAFDVASVMPALTPVIRDAWAILVDQSVYPQLDSATTIAAVTRRYELSDSERARANTVLQAALDLAQHNLAFADAYDQLSSARLGASIKNFDAAKFILANPTINISTRIKNNIQPNGAVSISWQELEDLSQTEFDKINQTLADMMVTVNTINRDQTTLLDYMSDKTKREKNEALAKAAADKGKLELDAAKSAVSVLTDFMTLIDPKFGKQLATIGAAAFKVGESINKWLDATAKLSTLGRLGSLSTIVMTGNIVSAVMSVVSLFQDSGPTPDQMILEQIGKLRKQIDDLHKDMIGRFDRIDKELNALYSAMQDRFNLIDLQLGKLNGNVQEIQWALIGIDLTLSRIERNNFEFLDAANRRPLLNTINAAIGYRKRTGLEMPYQPDFVANETAFQTWGTVTAFDPLSAGPTQRDFRDSQVLAELRAYPLDVNINYLNGWLLTHGLGTFANERLASPRDWVFASRAFAQLGLEWPEHMRRIDPEQGASLDRVGAALDAAMRRISTLDTPTGPRGNQPLFTDVSTYYRSKLAQLDTAIQSRESKYLVEITGTTGLQRAEPFDLWGGIDQSLTYQTPDVGTLACGGSQAPLPAPSNTRTFIPNFNRYNLAEYLKLGTIRVCLSAVLLNLQTPAPLCPPPNPDQVRCPRGNLQISVVASFENVPVAAPSWTSPFKVSLGMEETPQDYAVAHWDSLKAQFEAHATPDQPSPELAAQRGVLLDATTTALQTRLTGYQHELYKQVLNEVLSGSLQPVAVELAGGKVLLDSYIMLGFPRAVANDDFLRSLLFGSQRLVDDGLVGEFYATAISDTETITTAQIMTNTRVALGQLALQRTDALDGLLKQYLDAIGANTHVEEFSLAANTRLELRLSQRLTKLDMQRPIFLPLVRR